MTLVIENEMNETANECSVCYELTTDNLQCGHAVCHLCFEKWKLRSTTCPMCRSVFVDENCPSTSTTQVSNQYSNRISNRFVMNVDEIPGVQRLLPFDQWVAQDLAWHSRPPVNGFRFLKRVYLRNPSMYEFCISSYGFRVTAQHNTLYSRLYSSVISISGMDAFVLNVGDIVTHVNENSVMHSRTSVESLLHGRRPLTCHILDRDFFGRLIEMD